MIKILDKKVANKIKNRLNKYIEFKYEYYLHSVNNEDFTLDYQNEIHKTLLQYRGYCKDEFESVCLGVFILELSHLKRTQSWDITLNNKTKPLLNEGASKLLKAIEAFKINPYNIEEIIIKTKHPDNFLKSTSVNTDKITKDSTGPHLNISGRIAINYIMNGVSSKETIKEFQNIAKADKPKKKRTH